MALRTFLVTLKVDDEVNPDDIAGDLTDLIDGACCGHIGDPDRPLGWAEPIAITLTEGTPS